MKDRIQSMFSIGRGATEWNDMYSNDAVDFDKTLFQARRDIVCSMVEQHFDRDARLLDLGCGTGPLTEALLNAGYTHSLSIDYSLDMLRYAVARLATGDGAGPESSHPPGRGLESERAPHDVAQRGGRRFEAKLLQSDSQQLPLPNASLDGIACVGMISYVPEPEKAVQEMNRVLRPEGQLIITVRNFYHPLVFDPPRGLKHLSKALLSKAVLSKAVFENVWRRPAATAEVINPTPGAFIKRVLLERLLQANGFAIEQIRACGYGPLRWRGEACLRDGVSIALERKTARYFALLERWTRCYVADVLILRCRKLSAAAVG